MVKAEGSQVTVTVGAVEHPMLPEHFIEWIVLETQQGSQIKHLKPGEKPQAVFAWPRETRQSPLMPTATPRAVEGLIPFYQSLKYNKGRSRKAPPFQAVGKVRGLFRQPEKCQYFPTAARRKSPRCAR